MCYCSSIVFAAAYPLTNGALYRNLARALYDKKIMQETKERMDYIDYVLKENEKLKEKNEENKESE